MLSIVNYKYNKSSIIPKIKDWNYGTNWPSVYIFYNDKEAYVGETLDAVQRTKQHMAECEFDSFTDVCFISDIAFNKSVALDLESFLIKYVSADGFKKLTNGNAGIVEHNYFYKEAYEDGFKEIWNRLIAFGIVHKSLVDIGNSELYKYSPYKTLNYEQQETAYEIIKRISEMNIASSKSLIEIDGGAGTGKTILAVYLIKLLVDIKNNKRVWNAIDDAESALAVKGIAGKLTDINKIGFVVPMKQLRNTMKNIFDSIEGLNSSMVLAPADVVKTRFDILICDEAHRLYQRFHLPGAEIYQQFDENNRTLMGSNFQKDKEDFTELDWLIKSSRMQVLFYDKRQAIRVCDIEPERFERIVKDIRFKTMELCSQMRCQGGNGYYEYIRNILFNVGYNNKNYINFENYKLEIANSMDELANKISDLNCEYGLCRLVAGPNWKKDEDIFIEGKQYNWSQEKTLEPESVLLSKTITSIHKVQGFDLNYCGVIFGKEVVYNNETKRIEIIKNEVMDNHTKSLGDDEMRRFILNIYLTLMTRGIKGTIVYALDKNLHEYLQQFMTKING